MIFFFKAAQNLVAKHYARVFDTISHIKAAQNLNAKHYERVFDTISHF